MTIRIAFLAAFVGLALVVVPQAFAKQIIVDKDKVQCPRADFTSIQAAVTAALPGDTIKVCPDQYNESVNVNKPGLTVIGSSNVGDCSIPTAADPTKDSIVTGAAASFTLANNGITLSGFVVQGATDGIDTSDAFSGYRITNNTGQNNSVRGLNFLSQGTNLSRVDHNCFRLNGNSGVQSEIGNLTNGLVDHNASYRNVLDGFDFSGAGARSYVTVTRNQAVEDGFVGFSMDNSIGTEVSHNDMTGVPRVFTAGAGAFIGGGNNGLSVTYNDVTGGVGRGIRITQNFFIPIFPAPNVGLDVSYNTISGVPSNGIEVNQFSATTGAANLSTFSNNDVSTNGLDGIVLFPNNTGNRVVDNNADKNGRDGIHSAGATGNTYEDNHMYFNVEFDARDDNRPANTWTANHCVTDLPAGTICS